MSEKVTVDKKDLQALLSAAQTLSSTVMALLSVSTQFRDLGTFKIPSDVQLALAVAGKNYAETVSPFASVMVDLPRCQSIGELTAQELRSHGMEDMAEEIEGFMKGVSGEKKEHKNSKSNNPNHQG